MLCRFYQRGSCKFGDNCRYVHEDYNEDSYHNFYSPQSVHITRGGNLFNQFRENHFRDHRNYQPSDSRTNHQLNSNVKHDYRNDKTVEVPNPISIPEQYMMVVVADMEEWSNCGMWKLSCYGFLKNGRCLAGLEEFSFEEVRLACYQARMTNKYGSYLSWLHGILQRNSMFRNQFLNLDARQKQSLLSTIEKFVKKTEEEERASSELPVHRPTTVFGAPTQNFQQSNVFQQHVPPSNIPTQPTNIFQRNLVQAANVSQNNYQNPQQRTDIYVKQQQSPNPAHQDLQEVRKTLEHDSQLQKLQQKQSHPLALASHISSFGGSSQHQKGSSTTDINIYSDAKLLSDEDLKEFKADSFTFIPLAAPPKELV